MSEETIMWLVGISFLDEALLLMIFLVQALTYLGVFPPHSWFKWLRKKKR